MVQTIEDPCFNVPFLECSVVVDCWPDMREASVTVAYASFDL